MSSEWQFAPAASHEFRAGLRDLQPVTVQVLYARGLRTPAAARTYLSGATGRADPSALHGMAAAVGRILAAIAQSEAIVVYGDYDCDGVASCALLMTTLRALGAAARVYIPDRFDEGYGLHAAALDRLADEGARLVITVDCGARAVSEARRARARGVDLIITDHHALGPELPAVCALINPHQPQCAYPFKDLAGVGLAFRLAQSLLREARRCGGRCMLTERSLLDLVALGTVADVAPLVGENRALVQAGLSEMNAHARPGVAALMKEAGVPPGAADAASIAFSLGPRLNAAGRIGSAEAAYELLMAPDAAAAEPLAALLSERNAQRRLLTAQVAARAEHAAFSEDPDAAVLFAASEDYGVGVIGLAAARLVERHRRPAVVVTLEGDQARGSCRSVAGFNITSALDQCADLLHRYGGHAAAAGFTMPRVAVPLLADELRDLAADQRPAGGWRRMLAIDAEILPGELGPALHAELAQMEPHGSGNPRPLLLARALRIVSARTFGADDAHLELRLRDALGDVRTAVGWRCGERIDECPVGASLDVAFHPSADERDGALRLRLELVDWRGAGQ